MATVLVTAVWVLVLAAMAAAVHMTLEAAWRGRRSWPWFVAFVALFLLAVAIPAVAMLSAESA